MATRSVRRTRRYRRSSPAPRPVVATVQVFLFRAQAFVGSELFDAEDEISIGRHVGSSLQLDGDAVSRHHCRLVVEDHSVFVEDLGSSNGTLINRQPLTGRRELGPRDTVEVGAYALRTRLHLAEALQDPDVDDEVTTRIEAVVSLDQTGEKERHLAIESGLDEQLYADAIRRKTGAEAAQPPSPQGPIDDDSTVLGATNLDPALDAGAVASMGTRAPRPKSEASASDADGQEAPPPRERREIRSRLRDLDALIAALDRKREHSRRNSHVPWRSRRASEAPAPVEGSVTSRAEEPPRSQGPSRTLSTSEFARDLASRLALDGRVHANRESADNVVSLADKRASSRSASTTDRDVREPVEARLLTPHGAALSPISSSSEFDDVWTSPEARDRAEGSEQARGQDPSAPAEGTPSTEPKASMLPGGRGDSRTEEPTVAGEEVLLDWDGIEISARHGGKLVDIAVLRNPGEQYILGHRTPQGSLAPARCHVGLRLLKLGAEREPDLVFPKDVAGHLVRGGTTVMFTELTEGRKYSCLRLEAEDVVTVILGEGERAVSYHIRFLRRPRSLFRAVRPPS